MHSKTNLLALGCGEGEYSIYCRVPNKGNGQCSKDPDSLGKIYRDSVRGESRREPKQLIDNFLIGR